MDVDLSGGGSITVVDTTPSGTVTSAPKKRSRADAMLPADDEYAPDAHRLEEGSAPVHYVNENEAYGIEPEQAMKTPVQRLLDARHRRRRLGRHMANDQVQEDLDEVKKFLAMSEADREAYLSIYEYDGSSDNLVQGLARASSLALRVGLAYTVAPKDYDLASLALEMPEVKDSLETVWDCVDVTQYGDARALKTISAIGHVGDTLLGAAMKLYQGVAKAAELRQRSDVIERRKAAGDQSVFDISGRANNGQQTSTVVAATTSTTGTVIENI